MKTKVIDWNICHVCDKSSENEIETKPMKKTYQVALKAYGQAYVDPVDDKVEIDEKAIQKRINEVILAGTMLYGTNFLTSEQNIETLMFVNKNCQGLNCRIGLIYLEKMVEQDLENNNRRNSVVRTVKEEKTKYTGTFSSTANKYR